MTDVSANQRFKSVFEYLKSTKYVRNQQDFTERIKSDKATVSQVLNDKMPVPNKLFSAVGIAFPQIDPSWLMTGEGSMLRSGINQTNYGPNGKNEVDQSVKTGDTEALLKALEEISAMRLALEKSMAHNQKNTEEYFKLLNRLIDKN